MTKGHIKTLGSSNHTEQVREINDYYATNSDDVKIFLDKLQQDGIILKNTILEPACGQGHISDVLIAKGHTVQSSDLIDRGYGLELDYLTSPLKSWQGDIITNPPFKFASEFIYRSMDLLENEGLLLLLLPLRYLETKTRYALFQSFMPKYIYTYSYRIGIGKSGEFNGGNAVAYCWFIWEKGFNKESIIRFIPNPKWTSRGAE
tara:strand:- start:992 stop:1603 length:612 start_codon:yes stop_codon:yes gene_type:complete